MLTGRDLVLDRISALPPLPVTAARLLGLLRDPDVEMSQVVSAVDLDPGLTANTLRMANSALLAGNKKIATIREAVNRVGLYRIYQVVVTTVVSPMAKAQVSCYGLGADALWSHCVAVAAGSRLVAAVAGIPGGEEAFTAGLLHDVGKLILGSTPAAAEGRLVTPAGGDPLEVERQRFGTDHAEAGACLLEYWKFPQGLIDAVRFHHAPGDRRGAGLVHVADVQCRAQGLGCACEGPVEAVSPDALKALALTQEKLAALKVPLERAFNQAKSELE
jgi:putative nucleotidyltransferase with HDIG domain